MYPISGFSLVSVHFVKAESHRSTEEEEEEVEGGRGLLFMQIQAVFWVSGLVEGKRKVGNRT